MIDTLAEAFWLILEFVVSNWILFTVSSLIIYFNAAGNTFVWNGIFGVLQILALIAWNFGLLIRLLYIVVNLDYLVNVYDQDSYNTIVFYNPVSILFDDNVDEAAAASYWLQLLFGNKRSNIWFNLLMAVVLSLHPVSFMFSWYFLFQVPLQTILDIFVYPFVPQYDTPFVDWGEYSAYIEQYGFFSAVKWQEESGRTSDLI